MRATFTEALAWSDEYRGLKMQVWSSSMLLFLKQYGAANTKAVRDRSGTGGGEEGYMLHWQWGFNCSHCALRSFLWGLLHAGQAVTAEPGGVDALQALAWEATTARRGKKYPGRQAIAWPFPWPLCTWPVFFPPSTLALTQIGAPVHRKLPGP